VLVGYFSPSPGPSSLPKRELRPATLTTPTKARRTGLRSGPGTGLGPGPGPGLDRTSGMDPERSETRLRPESPSPVCPPVEGDPMFPPIDPARWHEVARQEYAAGPDDEAPFTTLTYERRCE
jgi:hypothetical protein